MRLASPRNALVLGAVAALIWLTVLGLTIATRDTVPSEDGVLFVAALVMGGLGTVIAFRQPENPTGWLMVAVMALSLTQIVAQLYSVLDYRQHGGRLPLGAAAVCWDDAYSLLTLLVGIPIVLLFPDGRLSRGWKRLLWCYIAVAAGFVATQLAGAIDFRAGRGLAVDVRPLRRRVQRRVDRRFNRARYNAEATVSAFSARLRDALDPDAIRVELLTTVDTAVAPAHASIWLRTMK